jgi:hypothetical protein
MIKSTSIKTNDFTLKRAATRFDIAVPLVTVRMNPHSQSPDLNVIDLACFSDVSKFPDVMEQQFILDADEMDDVGHAFNSQTTDTYKYACVM